jgi:NTP pyrophosphatase (non-canonical NTP hydrolase)
MNLNELSKKIHAGNVKRGLYDHPATFPDRCMLIVSEIAEAVEAHRENRMAEDGAARHIVLKMAEMEMNVFSEYFRSLVKDTVQDEIADAIIRLLDLSGYMEIDIDAHVAAKLAYNATRGIRHGKAY